MRDLGLDQPEFLTESETARMLRSSERTMQRLRQQGSGPPYVRLGLRRVLYPKCLLMAWAGTHQNNCMADQNGRPGNEKVSGSPKIVDSSAEA
jgi:hypothetical protein